MDRAAGPSGRCRSQRQLAPSAPAFTPALRTSSLWRGGRGATTRSVRPPRPRRASGAGPRSAPSPVLPGRTRHSWNPCRARTLPGWREARGSVSWGPGPARGTVSASTSRPCFRREGVVHVPGGLHPPPGLVAGKTVGRGDRPLRDGEDRPAVEPQLRPRGRRRHRTAVGAEAMVVHPLPPFSHACTAGRGERSRRDAVRRLVATALPSRPGCECPPRPGPRSTCRSWRGPDARGGLPGVSGPGGAFSELAVDAGDERRP